MQGFALLLDLLYGIDQGGHGVKLAAGNGIVDAFKFLEHHAACANVEVADFRIAHLTVWQTDIVLGSIDQRVRILAP